MSSPNIPNTSTIQHIDTSFDFTNQQHNPEKQQYRAFNYFLSEATIQTQLSPRFRTPSSTKYERIVSQQKQKLEEYKKKIKTQLKKSESNKLLNPSIKPQISTLVSRITALADKLSRIHDFDRRSKKSSSNNSKRNSSSSRPISSIRQQRSIEQIRRIVYQPLRQNNNYKQYVPRAEKLNYQPVSSKNKIRMLFEDRKIKDTINKPTQKRLSQIRSCTILPGVGRQISFRRQYYLGI